MQKVVSDAKSHMHDPPPLLRHCSFFGRREMIGQQFNHLTWGLAASHPAGLRVPQDLQTLCRLSHAHCSQTTHGGTGTPRDVSLSQLPRPRHHRSIAS
jgi:hypothetical protein